MHTNHHHESADPPSVLASLRALVPDRKLRFYEAQRIAELQANRLLALTHTSEAPIPSEIVSQLPRIRVDYDDLPISGLSFWDGHDWVICLNTTEPETRQRFTLLHEYKHIIDHGRTHQLYTGSDHADSQQQAEYAADFFAGCVLMPKRLIHRAWHQGIRIRAELACLFDVSLTAIEVRLVRLGLIASYEQRSAPGHPRHMPPLDADLNLNDGPTTDSEGIAA